MHHPGIIHHGAVQGVTGSCHELRLADGASVLVDCGLFQGAETSPDGAGAGRLEIDFDISAVKALLVTHCHIDHVGRIPYLLAAGFDGPVFCSEPSAELLPLVLEDAVRVGFTRDERLVRRFIDFLRKKLRPVPYRQWVPVSLDIGAPTLKVRFNPAGHILGSAYIQCRVKSQKHESSGRQGGRNTIIFSGDLGGAYTPLLPAPRAPYACDTLVLESTYGDHEHGDRRQRARRLKEVIGRCLSNRGTVLIPAFSIGRTQELLYELEHIAHKHGPEPAGGGSAWQDLEIVVDSPLAARFTAAYRRLRGFWDAEARRRLSVGRHPLSFEQVTTIDSHADHLNAVKYLARSGRPTIVLAASGMCAGGRIVNYLKAMLGDPRTDVLFVGYQAVGTPGRDIQRYGPKGGYAVLDGQRFDIRAGVHTLSGYSAHADRTGLINFVRRMRRPPGEIRLVHGDDTAKTALAKALSDVCPDTRIVIP